MLIEVPCKPQMVELNPHKALENLTTYCEVQKNITAIETDDGREIPVPKKFDWRLALLERIGGVTPTDKYDLEELTALAAAWPTCACGNMCEVLPRRGTGNNPPPVDSWLTDLGQSFYESILQAKKEEKQGNRPETLEWLSNALRTMERIETRTVELLVRDHGFTFDGEHLTPPS